MARPTKTTRGAKARPPAARGAGGRRRAPQGLTRRKTGQTEDGFFLPYQKAWINDEAPRKLGDKSRRTGFTYCEAYDAISRRFRRQNPCDRDYWFSSADDSAAQEFIDYCRFWAGHVFGALPDRILDGIEDPTTGRVATKYVVRCPNGHKIVAMTSNPRRFRSKGGDVCLDEYGFHDDARAMYTAASPVTRWGGTLRVFSTPNGEGSEHARLVGKARKIVAELGHDPDRPPRIPFDRLQTAAGRLRLTPVFSYHRVTILDAVAQGIVERVNSIAGTRWTREAFVADCREQCLDEESFQQEFMCVPGMDTSAWLTFALIEACERSECPRPLRPASGTTVTDVLSGYTGGPACVGVDFGRFADLSCFWILEQVGEKLTTRGVLYLRDVPTPEQEATLGAILRQLKLRNCNIDMTGAGLGLYEYARKRFGRRVHGVNFSASVPAVRGRGKATPAEKQPNVPVQHALAMVIRDAFEDQRVEIPADDALLRDGLHRVRKAVTPGGRVTFQAPRDKHGHADEFWALAMAVEGFAQGGRPWLALA